MTVCANFIIGAPPSDDKRWSISSHRRPRRRISNAVDPES
jgi:hypothetical protein